MAEHAKPAVAKPAVAKPAVAKPAVAKPAVAKAVASATAAHAGMRNDIIGRWGKLNAQEIGALASTDDLVKLVQEKYSIDKSQAQRDVDAFAHGRAL